MSRLKFPRVSDIAGDDFRFDINLLQTDDTGRHVEVFTENYFIPMTLYTENNEQKRTKEYCLRNNMYCY